MELQSILELMADGEYHSGKVLGELLGVSRTAVWKHLQKLEHYGLPLESVRGKGYRLPGGLELLDRQRIAADLGGADIFDRAGRAPVGRLPCRPWRGRWLVTVTVTCVWPNTRVRGAAAAAGPGSALSVKACICQWWSPLPRGLLHWRV